MKKVIFLALALLASASFCPIEAVKKKNKVVVFPAEALRLNNGSDSVSYAAGMSQRPNPFPASAEGRYGADG